MSRRNVVIGGGFFGAMLALALARRGEKVRIIEQESQIMRRASMVNQARIHGGYHYPRNRTTGRRSWVNMERFVKDFGDACVRPRTALYAVAARDSTITPRQFQEFCADIEADLGPTPEDLRGIFSDTAVAAHWQVSELSFDAAILCARVSDQLRLAGVDVLLRTRVVAVEGARSVKVSYREDEGPLKTLDADRVFNCTYAGLGQIRGIAETIRSRLKLELTEMALLIPPLRLQGLAITVMDGPFWSMQPYPPKRAYTLSHVTHTPHGHWFDEEGVNPYRLLRGYEKQSAYWKMIADAARFVPDIRDSHYIGSLWEVKAVLAKSEDDDGRPILFEKHPALPVWSVLGAKIDNIYDLLAELERAPLLESA